MDGEELHERVRALHAQGFSTNAITRALGAPRARVAPLVRELSGGRTQTAVEPALVGCWVSAGWSTGLRLPPDHDWPDIADPDPAQVGLIGVLVAREHRRVRSSVSVCGYLVDPYCLGVKNALGPRTMGRRALDRFADLFFEVFDAGRLEAPIELVRELVLGAVDYARGLGFEPHPDLEPATGHLGERAEPPGAIGFGLNGKPCYHEGPFDDVGRIMRTLDERVGLDNVHFTVTAPLQRV